LSGPGDRCTLLRLDAAVFRFLCGRLVVFAAIPFFSGFTGQGLGDADAVVEVGASASGGVGPEFSHFGVMAFDRSVSAGTGRSGSPGQLPTRGSHRSGRAAFPHPAPRISASLRHGKYCEPRAGAAGDNGSINDGSAPSPYLNGWTADSATCASSVRPAAENATGLAHCR